MSGSGIQFTYLDKAASDLRTSFSGEYRLDKAYAPHLIAEGRTVGHSIYKLSGAAEWSMSPSWVLHGGAMLEHYSDTDGTHLSPRLALNWLPTSSHIAINRTVARSLEIDLPSEEALGRRLEALP